MLAAGHIDLVIETGLKPYDIVALIPIIEGAGGIVTTWSGGSAAGAARRRRRRPPASTTRPSRFCAADLAAPVPPTHGPRVSFRTGPTREGYLWGKALI